MDDNDSASKIWLYSGKVYHNMTYDSRKTVLSSIDKEKLYYELKCLGQILNQIVDMFCSNG